MLLDQALFLKVFHRTGVKRYGHAFNRVLQFDVLELGMDLIKVFLMIENRRENVVDQLFVHVLVNHKNAHPGQGVMP